MVLSGCGLLEPSQFEPEIVVSGFLEAGKSFPSIRVTTTSALEVDADPASAAVTDARVSIQWLSDNGEIVEEYMYGYLARSNGLYRLLPGQDEPVEPLRTYRLVVDVPDHPTITATTTVPDTFTVRANGPDTVVYQSDAPFTFDVAGAFYPGRQSFFIFTTSAFDGLDSQLTPFARRILEESDDITLADLRERASPILNEESFERVGGALRISFPWLGINFYGRNRVIAHAIDDNLYDFVRSHSVQQGGSTRPPGEIPNVLDPIEGGRGVFGSFASASIDFFVLRSAD